jgi:ubiquinone/menaquinone biosynthesis C-methylase UbiE
LVGRVTKKYLRSQDGPILEGGCGVGQFVYLLSEAGYKCIGIDIAEETIKRARKANPSLNLEIMDVRELEFPDNYFAGYWSLGVIEHFFEGYDEILNEMSRVVKPGGDIFVTVPVMSLQRRLKAFFGFYETASEEINNKFSKSDFYQFIFTHKKLINNFTKNGLELVEIRNKGGIKGLGDEVAIFKAPFRFISGLRNKNIVFKSLVKLLDIILSPVAGHMGLFVFKKQNHT